MKYAITIEFPVSSHVHKYLTRKYGPDAMDVSRSEAIGYWITGVLNRTPDQRVSKLPADTYYRVRIKDSAYYANGMFIDKKKLSMFNKLVDKLFREELFHFVKMSVLFYNEKEIYALKNFCDYYQITDDDINIDSLVRDYKRRKISEKKLVI